MRKRFAFPLLPALLLLAANAAPPLVQVLPTPKVEGEVPLPVATPSPPMAPEQWMMFAGQRVARNVSVPTLTPVLPDPSQATGAAVIVAPGGGFHMLSMDSEGFEVARRLAANGVAAFVLKYRLIGTPEDPQQFPRAMARIFSGRAGADELDDPLAQEDALRAIAWVRAHAADFSVDPAKVGLIGFSAGAITGLAVALGPDASVRPNFVGLIYGPMAPVSVPADAPPLFAALANNDPLFGHKGFGLVESWLSAHRSAELHAYEAGGHGFGMRPQGTTSDGWIDDWMRWLRARKLAR